MSLLNTVMMSFEIGDTVRFIYPFYILQFDGFCQMPVNLEGCVGQVKGIEYHVYHMMQAETLEIEAQEDENLSLPSGFSAVNVPCRYVTVINTHRMEWIKNEMARRGIGSIRDWWLKG